MTSVSLFAKAAARRPPPAAAAACRLLPGHCKAAPARQPAPPAHTPHLFTAEGGKVVRRVARLPTRLFADGSFARGVAADGLYGLARVTVHEAELDLAALKKRGHDADADAAAGVRRWLRGWGRCWL